MRKNTEKFRKYEGHCGLKQKKSNQSNWFEILFLTKITVQVDS